LYLPLTTSVPDIPWLEAIAIGFAASLIFRVARGAAKAFFDGLRGKR